MKRIILIFASVIVLIVIGRLFYFMLFDKNSTTNVQDIKSDLQSGRYDYNLGTQKMKEKDFSGAENHFLEVIKYKDQVEKDIYINTLVNLGICCANQQKLADAEKYWKEAASMGDEDAAKNLRLLHQS
ncbi:hypothetical protein [Mucilaginibacter phyllosphaerae]|uniref:Tetratricopeptide (TPR) repeat protein n=1 Tax=Mucilaginibacter phyllosphaerae TaxID=1812349 RepID=A0A4Y8AK50_9SPHI|nr:hypothetical protein [Mucilaginibacter phyllosphaerae]MBB3968098.1 tetratricopeptide (TPR) repeat protein [Mucilaginibacter phyllosphaerae]TEW68879.1 hypothetical protein E2R65_01585 [Mucilaginibacter phyllosphaerae]GGH01262.1 hypothetical protein GCM10007352_02910 [Mucilaginibacter phyllosphaerae]